MFALFPGRRLVEPGLKAGDRLLVQSRRSLGLGEQEVGVEIGCRLLHQGVSLPGTEGSGRYAGLGTRILAGRLLRRRDPGQLVLLGLLEVSKGRLPDRIVDYSARFGQATGDLTFMGLDRLVERRQIVIGPAEIRSLFDEELRRLNEAVCGREPQRGAAFRIGGTSP